MDTNTILIIAGFWIVCGIAALLIAQSKGQTGSSGFLLGLLLGPFGVVLALVAKPVAPVEFASQAAAPPSAEPAAQPNGLKLVAIFAAAIIGIVIWAFLTVIR